MFVHRALHSICITCLFLGCFISVVPTYAQESDDVRRKKLFFARVFVGKMKSGFNEVDHQLQKMGGGLRESMLPDGEVLLLQPVFGRNIYVDNVITARIHNKKALLSLRDFADSLRLAIEVDVESGEAQGWYIRESKTFNLNFSKKAVATDNGEFVLSNDVLLQEGDIWVPVAEIMLWLGIELNASLSEQELKIESPISFPLEAELLRRKKKSGIARIEDPVLPLTDEGDYKAYGVPIVDVSTDMSYRKNGDQSDAVKNYSALVRTSGDVAYGTVTTQSRWDNRNQLSSVQATYKRESVEPDLLGPLNARRFEAGDITTVNVPFGRSGKQDLGVRVTNSDPLRAQARPNTGISGNAIPGWDVELYRNGQYIAFQQVDDEGFYQFTDVDLFQSDNNFRLVFYGPQGERHEEDVFIPVDNQTLSRGSGTYDVSVSLNEKTTYSTGSSSDIDEGSLDIAALYEKPIGASTAIIGVQSYEENENRITIGNLGISTVVKEFLLNGDVAMDDDGDIAAELSARHDFGRHQFSNTLSWDGKGFDTGNGNADIDDETGVLGYNVRLNGPMDLGLQRDVNYSLSGEYVLDTDNEDLLTARAGLNTGVSYFTFNGQLSHRSGRSIDNELNGFLGVTGTYGKNRLRLNTDYQIVPEQELNSVTASYRHRFSNKMEFELQAQKNQGDNRTDYSARLDWQAGFARISPRITYNSEDDFFAGLSTRFGLLRDPSTGDVEFLDRNVTNVGALSVFVYLDKNGNGLYDGDDEPLPDIVVSTPQNSRRGTTGEDGVALFTRMTRLRVTDVYIDSDSLPDPLWVPGFDGVSIVPREGYVAQVEFPIHMAGEIDGIVYARPASIHEDQRPEGYVEPKPIYMRNVALHLYNREGEIEQTVTTDTGGFYYFTQVPPGRYFLVVDETSAKKKRLVRPVPEPIEVGYEGTIIYGNNIFMEPGKVDVPGEFVPDLDEYKSRHPHIDFSEKYDLVLNLGEYNSRLLMSLVWYKLQSRYHAIIGGADLFVTPAKSYPDVKTGKHVLRVGLEDQALDQAYNRCRALIARDQACKVEIYPSFMKRASAQDDAASKL
ncbi:MAG: hypothetical protein ACRBDL_02255 [Alphaproteobacteria bacterium]